jgi:uncharacterized protein YndB with AHSA1/START domain
VITRSVAHTSFVIERDLPASPDIVFDAWADPVVRRRWSDCHPEHTTDFRADFRPHGHETHRVVYPGGEVQLIEKVFFDIVAGQRIAFAYDIQLDGRRFSVSLVTIEFHAAPHGTHMILSEQLTYFDGHEDRAQRIKGTEEGIDRLLLELQTTLSLQ